MGTPSVRQNEQQAVIRRILDLAPLPVVAQRLLDDLADDDASIAGLSAIIELDPGLTARIVGLANSAYFASPSPVYSVQDAITRVLGLNMVRSVALGIALNAPFDTRRCRPFQLDRYWFVAMATAWLARSLAPRLPPESAVATDLAYLGGMMHNFGLIVLASAFPAEMSNVLNRSAIQPEADMASLEEDEIGINHHLAAGALARKWHLPPAVVAAVESGGRPDDSPEFRGMCRLIDLCANQAHALYFREERQADPAALEALGLNTARFAGQREKLRGKVEEIETLARQMAG